MFLQEFYLYVTDSLRIINFMKQKHPASLEVQGSRLGPPWGFNTQAGHLGAASSLENSLQLQYV